MAFRVTWAGSTSAVGCARMTSRWIENSTSGARPASRASRPRSYAVRSALSSPDRMYLPTADSYLSTKSGLALIAVPRGNRGEARARHPVRWHLRPESGRRWLAAPP